MSGDETSLDQILAGKHGQTGPIVNVDEPVSKLVVFTLAGERFAFHGDRIREILPDCPVFPLPGCPESLEGVINVRGDIESVIDLRVALGYAKAPDKANTRILLGHARETGSRDGGAGMRSGLRVDVVEEVMDVPHSRIQAPPNTVPEHRRAIILGVVPFGGHLVTLLDLDRVFADYRAGL